MKQNQTSTGSILQNLILGSLFDNIQNLSLLVVNQSSIITALARYAPPVQVPKRVKAAKQNRLVPPSVRLLFPTSIAKLLPLPTICEILVVVATAAVRRSLALRFIVAEPTGNTRSAVRLLDVAAASVFGALLAAGRVRVASVSGRFLLTPVV
jgi:hypothetical protein